MYAAGAAFLSLWSGLGLTWVAIQILMRLSILSSAAENAAYVWCLAGGIVCAIIGGIGGHRYGVVLNPSAIKSDAMMCSAAVLAGLGLIVLLTAIVVIIHQEIHFRS